MVEVKHVDLPQEMQRAMARQAVAEREKRAKIIHAEGEFIAARQLTSAAEVMDKTPTSLQLRYLQTLIEMASDRTSTVVFPVPVDIIEYFPGPAATSSLDRRGEGASVACESLTSLGGCASGPVGVVYWATWRRRATDARRSAKLAQRHPMNERRATSRHAGPSPRSGRRCRFRPTRRRGSKRSRRR